jgi:uncharacterized protein YjbI with pentapeptide repeats
MPQDFSGQNLRGRSFKGQNLAGVNFSYADIRGADFTNANLKSANFKAAKAGLQSYSAILFVIFSLLLPALLGLSSGLAYFNIIRDLVENFEIVDSFVREIFGITVTLLVFITFSLISICQSWRITVTTIILSGVIVGTLSWIPATPWNLILTLLWFAASALSSYITVAINVCVAITVGCHWAIVWSLILPITISATVYGSVVLELPVTLNLFLFFIGVLVLALSGVLLSGYISHKVLAGDEKYSLIRTVIFAFTAIGGTSFRGADLTDADFTQAMLKSTDIRNAILIHTCFQQAKMLDCIRPGETYLQRAEVRQLLVTGQGQDKKFERQDLQGVNLQGANLTDASFTGSNLSKGNFQDADLSRAKLVQTQLDGTDFTGATLTGAYIQDWGITTDTKFDGVRCEYVYMRLPTKENPDPLRKPDNHKEFFADGEFGDFIQPIFDTLDLYHNQGVDPRAIAISFKQLAENYPDAELEIVAMEKRGQDKFLLRAKTAATADKSELSAEYFATYNEIKGLPEREIKLLLEEKDDRIRSLETMVMTALQSPKFYAENYNNQGDTMSQSPKKQSNFNLQGAQFAGGLVDAETVTANQIGGNITNYTPEQRQNLAQAAAEIQQLLNQLGQTYPTNTPLEKQIVVTEALKQIESNPTLKARVIGALKVGGTEALKEFLDHPVVNVLLAALEGWQNAE